MPDFRWSHAAVFVSSTWLNLQEERKAVELVLQRFRETKFVGMEYFGSQGETTEAVSRAEVDRADLYIGVIGPRYGSGITEAEYRAARNKGLDCLIYFATDTTREAQNDPSLARFCAELRKAHTVTEFRNADELAARVAADLHNWVMNRWLTTGLLKTSVDGVNELPTDYTNRIQNFLHEYLGGENRPVPFGGRAEEISRLDEWLESGPPYGIVAAPAGRGKSALVARWARKLLARPDTHIVFFPVSIRFRTNLASVVFVSLAARLARIFGEPLRASADMTAEVCRGLVASYLRRGAPAGTQLVVVVDGLDEAADWEAGADLFPIDPPTNVHVLVTARYRAGDVDARAWLTVLGWPPGTAWTIDLMPLTLEGLLDVLVRMGAPLDRLVTKVDVVAELFRLSEGDPLLVRLYADDLWLRGEAANRLKPEDLVEIHPGLEGYFERWWLEQKVLWKAEAPLRERSVQAVLNLLACALGPLMRADLMRLAPVEAGLNTWTLDGALQPLGRFVIGDGKRQGYVLSHPRLANYFYDLFTPAERRDWEARFIAWGAEKLSGLQVAALPAREVPDYLLQYYGAHLDRSQASAETLLALVNDGWRQAWLAHEGAYTGFLNDVERAWRAVECADRKEAERGCLPQRLSSAIQCALCMASVRSLAANVRPEMLAALVKQGIWTATQALAFVRQMPSEQQRYDGLRVIADLLPPGLVDEAAKTPIPHLPPELAGRLAACGRGSRALDIARSLEWDNDGLTAVLVSIGRHINAADAEVALTLAAGLPSRQRVQAELALVGSLSLSRRTEVLETELRRVIKEPFEDGIHGIAAVVGAEFVARVGASATFPDDRLDALLVSSALTRYLPESQWSEAIAKIMQGLIEERQMGWYPAQRRHAVLANLLPLWTVEERRKVLDDIIGERPSEDLIRRVKPYLETRQVLSLLGIDRELQPGLLVVLAGQVPQDAWGELVGSLLGENIDAAVLSQVCAVLPEAVFCLVRDRVIAVEDDDEREFGLWAIAPRLTAPDILDALDHGLWLEENVRLCEALARRLAELGSARTALDLVRRLKKVTDQSRVLIAIGHAASGSPEALRAVVAEAGQLPYAPETLGTLAGVLPPDLLRDALAAVQRINDQTALMAVRQYLWLELAQSGDVVALHQRVKAARHSLSTEWLEKYASRLADRGCLDEAFEVETWVGDGRVLRAILNASPEERVFRKAIPVIGTFVTVDRAVWRNMVERWPPEMEKEAVDYAEHVGEGEERAEAISILAKRLKDTPGSLFQLACSISEAGPRANALAGLAVSGNHREDSLRTLAAMAAREEDFGPGSRALLALWTMLEDEYRNLVIQKVRAADNAAKAAAIVELAHESKYWPELKQIAGTLAEPTLAVAAALLVHAPDGERLALISQAFEAVQKLGPWSRFGRLTELAPLMAEPFAEQAWLEAWHLALENEWTWVLGELLQAMPDRLVQTAVSSLAVQVPPEVMGALLDKQPDGNVRQAALAAKLAMLPVEARLPARRRRLTLKEIAAIQDPWERASALTSPGWSDDEEWDSFGIAKAIPEPGARAYAVGDFLLEARTWKVREAAEQEAMKLAVSGHLGRAQTVEALKRTRSRADSEWRMVALRLLENEWATASAHRSGIDPDLFSDLGRALPRAESYTLWARVLRRLALGTRAELFGALKPMLRWWGGDVWSLEGTAEAVEKAVAWWP